MKSWFLLGIAATLILLLEPGCNRASRESQGAAAPAANESSSAQPASVDDPLERGRRAYFKHCVACHSPDTDEYVAGLALKDYFNNPPTELSDGTLFPRNDEAIRELIATGTKNMPPLIKGITPQELNDILAYMHTL